MSEIQIRLPRDLWKRLFAEVRQSRGRESVVFGLVSHASNSSRELILVRDIVVPAQTAFLPSLGHGARWSGRYMVELLNKALSIRSGLFIFHFHGGHSVQMSADDHNSARQLLPRFQVAIPDRPHGSIVLGDDSAAGLILMPGQDAFTGAFTLRYFGRQMVTWPLPQDSTRECLRFERQPLVLGSRVQKILAASRITIVGQSGGGSHVAQQLAYLGIGETIGIDDDTADAGNRFSGVAFGTKDIARRCLKVETIRRHIRRIDPNLMYKGIPVPFPEKEALDQLKRADVIVGCVNNLHARADIQDVALRYLIPYVDIGLGTKQGTNPADEFPPIDAIVGNIFTFVPGGPCMWCTGFLDKEKLDRETQRRGRPYLKTIDNAPALVLSFNGVLASQAVTDVLQLLVGFAPEEWPSVYKKYDGFSGTVLPWKAQKNAGCYQCRVFSASGDPVWKPAD